MKKLITIILVIMLNMAIISNTFAYDLTESDKKSTDNITLKLESFISKKGENYRNILVERLKNIDSSKSDKLKAYIDYIVLALNKSNTINSYKTLKIENNNIVLYENGKKVIDLTKDGNSDKDDLTIDNIYKIEFITNDFSLIRESFIGGENGAYPPQFYLFDNNNGNNIINIDEKFPGVLSEYLYSTLITIKNNKLIISGKFIYEECIYKNNCEKIDTNKFITKENIKKYGIKIIKDSLSYDNPGEFELIIDYKDLF